MKSMPRFPLSQVIISSETTPLRSWLAACGDWFLRAATVRERLVTRRLPIRVSQGLSFHSAGRLGLFALFLLLAFVLHADTNAGKTPSPKVDKALRERITQFYQRQVERRYRDAEQFVAADTKDYFYSANKADYLSCAFDHIEYLSDAKRAKAWVQCERTIMFPGFAGQVLKMPVISTWKLEKGKWFWYVDQKGPVDTPFGQIKSGAPGGQQPAGSGAAPFSIPTVDVALNKVKADKTALTLKPGGKAEVTFTNTASGVMAVSCRDLPDGISVSPLKVEMKQGGSATVTVEALQGASGATLNFGIEPTGETIGIPVKIQ